MYLRTISTLGCGELDLDEARTLARRHGLDGIELRALGGTLDLPGWLKARYGQPMVLASVRDDPPLPVAGLGTSFRLVGATAEERSALVRHVPWAEALGAAYLRVFDGGPGSYGPAETAEARSNLDWWREQRALHGWKVDLMVETHDSLLTGGDIARFASAAGGVPVLWDAHHTWRKGAEDPLVTWAAIARQVVHIHVKDSRAGQYVLPGTGEFPLAPLRAVLAREYGGAISLEWERWWQRELPSLDQALDAAWKNDWW